MGKHTLNTEVGISTQGWHGLKTEWSKEHDRSGGSEEE